MNEVPEDYIAGVASFTSALRNRLTRQEADQAVKAAERMIKGASAIAWQQGFLFGYYLDRGYSEDEALKRATQPVPTHLEYPPWLDGENPYCDTERSDWDAD